MSLQPSNTAKIDRTTSAPFLLRLFWRQNRPLEAHEFAIAPPADTTNVTDYTSLLPASIRQHSVQIYTWPTCTLAELTALLTSVLPEGLIPSPNVGTRLVYKLIFPDTRGGVSESGKGRWVDKPLGSVVIGGRNAEEAVIDDDAAMNGVDGKDNLTGDAEKTLADARFVIGDYIACTIYPPTQDGRIAGPPPPPSRPGGRGPPRENGYPPRGPGGGYRGGNRGAPPPMGDWRRGERPPPPSYGSGGGYRGGGRGGRPY